MSDSHGPVRRRRIAGETGPAGPAKKAVPVARTGRKPATAKRSEPAAKAEPATKAPKPVKAPKTSKPAKTPTTGGAATAPTTAEPAARATPKKPAPVSRPVAVPSSALRSGEGRSNEADGRPAGSRPSRRDLVWLVPSTLLAVAALVLGVLLVVDPPGSSDGDLDASRRQASSAAAGAAETIFSFRYDQLDEHLAASKALMTPAFAKDFEKIAPALTELAPQRQIQVQAAVRDAAALPCGDECSPDRADVLVFVDQARLVGGASTPTVFANRIKVSMVKNGDGWRVADIRAL